MSKLIDLIGLTNIANDIRSWVNAHFLRKEDVPDGSTPSTTTPKMDGVASVGTENAFARGDHRHPSDTSKQDAIADLDDIRRGAAKGDTALQSFTETDPTVPSWAKQTNKPTYTASEVGALPDSTIIPTVPTISNDIATDASSTDKTASPKAVKDYVDITVPTTLASLSDDATHRTVTDTEKTTWNAKSNFSGSYNDLTDKPTIPTVPVQDVTVGGTSVVSNGTAVIPQEVFWATYGTTTAAEIDAAVAAGKLVMCNYSNHSYRLEDYRDNQPLYFSCFISSQMRYYLNISRTTNVWSGGTITHENAAVNKVSTITGNETSTTKYPNTKAVADALGKWGVMSQTQTWSGTGTQPRTYVMSDLVYGTIPQANIDLYVAAGATFNTTTGYFELNGLTDISYEEMSAIYAAPHYTLSPDLPNRFAGLKARTIIPYIINIDIIAGTYTPSQANIMCLSSRLETFVNVIKTDGTIADSQRVQTLYYAFNSNYYIRSIKKLLFHNTLRNIDRAFVKCYSLEEIELCTLNVSISFSDSSLLNLASIVYMVQNAANTSAITITLHADALARCTADTTEYTYNGNTYTGIVALATAKNITLAS